MLKFISYTPAADATYDKGTATVEFDGKIVELPANRQVREGQATPITVSGFSAKFRTGTKAWHASLTFWMDKETSAWNGRPPQMEAGYDRINKGAPILTGLWADRAVEVRSRHGKGRKTASK